ncbi:hypothetical protein Tco_0771488 [Tanacetum coccineum]|uniref:Uncharacterized protein n=1 Tax=Tanacetum coccineum TaxID=301880 RepID=A0ABQ4ZI45_9ASTR
MSKDSRVELMDMTLTAREKAIDMLKLNLTKAQNRMKVQADKHMSEREFLVGDEVYNLTGNSQSDPQTEVAKLSRLPKPPRQTLTPPQSNTHLATIVMVAAALLFSLRLLSLATIVMVAAVLLFSLRLLSPAPTKLRE